MEKNIRIIDGGICAPKGFRAAAVHAGIKFGSNPEKPDLGIIASETLCNAAGVFTRNKVKGSPLIVSKLHLENGKARAITVNSGNANTCNKNGVDIAVKTCRITANELDINSNEVIVASTGVIGQRLFIEPFEKFIPVAVKRLSVNGSDEFCRAIMTTDTVKKEIAAEFELGEKTCRIGACAKGSGMINPNMATLLCFITTDAAIEQKMLQTALSFEINKTLNYVSVDGDTSTNDMAIILANGLAGNEEITEKDEDYDTFLSALNLVLSRLAVLIAKDGEGASKLIRVIVQNAPTKETAQNIAESVINSPLVKSALSAADANWGRILCAVGNAKGIFDVSNIEIIFESDAGHIQVCDKSAGVCFSEKDAGKILAADEVNIYINMNCESSENQLGIAIGCDLTEEYVKINAEYRT